jgi:hypothetical protein
MIRGILAKDSVISIGLCVHDKASLKIVTLYIYKYFMVSIRQFSTLINSNTPFEMVKRVLNGCTQ